MITDDEFASRHSSRNTRLGIPIGNGSRKRLGDGHDFQAGVREVCDKSPRSFCIQVPNDPSYLSICVPVHAAGQHSEVGSGPSCIWRQPCRCAE